jgi:hypothetical protein
MTAYVTIPVATVQSALKLPNTALRYKPPVAPEEIQALYKRYGIEGGVSVQDSTEPAMIVAQNATQASGAQSLPRVPKADAAVVWKLHSDNSMEPVKVSLGITDHAFTEVNSVLKGQLKEGDEVVIRSVVSQSQGPSGIRR